jgi:hypothetical protein
MIRRVSAAGLEGFGIFGREDARFAIPESYSMRAAMQRALSAAGP